MNSASELPVSIVLVGTTHPGNIGAAARAMKTMGLDRLRLVQPRMFPHADATARAAGADDILAGASVHETLAEAVADARLILGTSARLRNLSCPMVTPEQAAAEALAVSMAGHEVALVFGRERSGLSNEELDLCQRLIVIPTREDFSSLNLAAAVQILCYEIRRQQVADVDTGPIQLEDAVNGEQMEHFYAHLEQSLRDIGFLDPERPRRLMRRMRRLYNRAGLDQNEYNILRGILTAIQDVVRRK